MNYKQDDQKQTSKLTKFDIPRKKTPREKNESSQRNLKMYKKNKTLKSNREYTARYRWKKLRKN